MKKKVVTILLVVLLFIGGTISLLVDEETTAEDMTNDHGLREPQPTGTQANPCGGSEGNGGGNPG